MEPNGELQKKIFPGQEQDETVVRVLRRHAVAMSLRFTSFIIVALVPLLVALAIGRFSDWLDDRSGLFFLLLVLSASLVYLFLILLIYHTWMDHYLDVWVVSNERIVAIEQKGLFNRTTSELRLSKVQDVTSEIKGLLPTLFKYGRVQVQTASESEKFIFREVPNPDQVARQILELHEHYLGIDQQVGPAAGRSAAGSDSAATAKKETL